MQIGLSAFPTDYSIHPTRLAREAEARGFESLFVVEHTHIPASRRSPYPAGGDLPRMYWETFDPFVYLAQAAAVTTALKIGTGICLVPEHHPLSLAKRVASLDSLSGGRFLFGIGAGWNAEELENHGVAFENRWNVLREHVLAMKQVWTEKDAEFHGKYVDFDPVWAEPKPATKPHPPILIGASSSWSMRRIVEYGDGWMPIFGTCNLEERLKELDERCAEAGRDRSQISVSVFGVGAPEIAEQLEKHEVDRLLLPVPPESEDDVLKVLDSYATLLER